MERNHTTQPCGINTSHKLRKDIFPRLSLFIKKNVNDYEKVEDPAAEKNKLAVSDEWINALIAKLS